MNLNPNALALWLFSFLIGYLFWNLRMGLLALFIIVGFSLVAALVGRQT